jgi:3-phenylpropionate/trans-cinnamate dioxygenase ferredoxin reductase subunit
MSEQQTVFDVVVIGGGVAAGACVSTLREEGFTGSIAVACAEPHPPYTRPGLTKQVLRGEKPETAALWRPEEWYAANDVTLLTGSAATDLDVRAKRVRVAGRSIAYDRLVLAPGAEPRSLDLGDAVRDRVHVVRSFADARSIRPHLGAGNRWLVIGGGFIGAEFAASARLTGSDVHLVMPEALIVQAAFGDVAAGWFDARLRANGVDVHARTTVESVTRSGDELHALLTDGTELVVDHVCVGIGVAPNVGLAQQAGLDLELRGIATDRSLRTSASSVYAAGDVCAYDSVLHGARTRIEHWDVAKAHGAHIGMQIASGEHSDFDHLPYFFGTMGDWAYLEYVGTGTGASAVVRGTLDGEDMSIAYLDDDGVLVGLITVGRSDDLADARTLITDGARLDASRVADADVRLSDSRVADVALGS